jgi:cryptochrome
LLDADWALNAANWQWLSASAFFHQYFRVYSPIVFGQKTDKNGDFIRKYVPVLRNFPAQFIYEPWLAPKGAQVIAKCVVGVDYPRPIVDHSIISKVNIGRMKKAYDANKAAAAESDSDGEEKSGQKKAKPKAAAGLKNPKTSPDSMQPASKRTKK